MLHSSTWRIRSECVKQSVHVFVKSHRNCLRRIFLLINVLDFLETDPNVCILENRQSTVIQFQYSFIVVKVNNNKAIIVEIRYEKNRSIRKIVLRKWHRLAQNHQKHQVHRKMKIFGTKLARWAERNAWRKVTAIVLFIILRISSIALNWHMTHIL